MRNAVSGYYIIEIRNGERIRQFPKKSCSRFELAKVRIFDLCRDKKFKYLSVRKFEIWDGITGIAKISVNRNGDYSIKPYLLQPLDAREKMGYESDVEYPHKMRRNNQRTGPKAGDLTAWTVAGAMSEIPSSMHYKSGPFYNSSGPCKKRSLGVGTVANFGHQPRKVIEE